MVSFPPGAYRASPVPSFLRTHSPVAAISHPRAALSINRSRSPASSNALHASLRECVRSLHAQTHPLEYLALYPLAYRAVLVQSSLSLALLLPFSQSYNLHEIKTQSRLCVPLAHSDVDSFRQLSKPYTDCKQGIALARLISSGR